MPDTHMCFCIRLILKTRQIYVDVKTVLMTSRSILSAFATTGAEKHEVN